MDPQLDPRIVHLWSTSKAFTLCGITMVELANARYFDKQHDLRPGTKVVQCRGCYRESARRA